MFWHKFPYTDAHELNLDYILSMIKTMYKDISEFEAVNKITYAGAWDITKQYPAWTVVTENKIGYISLKPVPIGVPITNTEYWEVISGHENIPNRKFILIGDSYGVSPDATTNWQTLTMNCLKLTEGTDCFKIALPGAGFSVNGSRTFQNLLETVANDISKKNEITDIIVGGGVNDIAGFTDTTELANAMRDFMDKARELFPNAIVRVAYIGYYRYGNTTMPANADNIFYNNMQSYYKYGATTNGAAYLSGCEKILHNRSYMSADDVHPNINGALALSQSITNAILTGSDEPSSIIERIIVQPTDGTINGASANAYLGLSTLTPDSVSINLDGINWSPGSAVTISNVYTKIGDFSGATYANDPVDIEITGIAILTDVDPLFKAYPFGIRLHQGSVYVRTTCYENATYTHTLTALSIPNVTIDYDIMKN